MRTADCLLPAAMLTSFLLHTDFCGAQSPAIAEQMKKAGAESMVYKTTVDARGNEVKLRLYVFKPEDHKATDRRPAIVFFFGGGWRSGSPAQFEEHCKHLASRGMVAMTADYRVSSRQGTKAVACVSDGKSAVRWIRQNATQLGVDAGKVAAGGGSAGGHVAAATAVVKQYDESSEDAKISSVPDALVLFNPALVLAPIEGKFSVEETRLSELTKRIGADPKTISPVHHVASGAPATIIFHGKADTTVPYLTAQVFTETMKAAGNRCELVGYEKQGHGFFNVKRKNGKYKETVAEMDKFLVSLVFLAKD